MYAVFETGGKQYRAGEGEVVRVEKIKADEGATVALEKVLLVVDGDDIKDHEQEQGVDDYGDKRL